MSETLFDGFTAFDIDTGSATIHGVQGGAGPPLLLLHGYPQTHAMWHRVAGTLASRFSVVAADLRGYGASSKPTGSADHATYSKRAMAADMVTVMTRLGYSRFGLCGHDRGGRVGHRLALDFPEAVSRLMVLDIAPTREMYANTDAAFAEAYWHWFFLIQPAPFPENLIGADADAFWRYTCGRGSAGLSIFDARAVDAYLRAFRDPATQHACCEDYRAAASIDIVHDDADGDRRIACPLHVVWGSHGVIERCFDALALWRLRADTVSGFSLPGGHYLAEELPDETAAAIIDFFDEETDCD